MLPTRMRRSSKTVFFVLAALWLAGVPVVSAQSVTDVPSAPVAAGNRIAGTSPRSAFLDVMWRVHPDMELGADVRVQGPIPVDDVNSDFAAGYAVTGFRLRWTPSQVLGGHSVELLARVDNLFDKAYSGSVIVNDANGRYFETGAPRSLMLAVRVSL